MATAFGAMEHFSLPAAGIVVGFPKAQIMRPNGDACPKGVTPDDEVLRQAAAIAAAAGDPKIQEYGVLALVLASAGDARQYSGFSPLAGIEVGTPGAPA